MQKVTPDEGMQLRLQFQKNDVADEVSAITAVVRPILEGILYALKGDIVQGQGGHKKIGLDLLARLYRAGDRDCGICFEYAVHDALLRQDTDVSERVYDALKLCKISGDIPSSILFGAEKTGALNLINTAKEKLTDESRLLAGTRGQPVKLKRHIDSLAAAFRKKGTGVDLPWSISAVWKADLFVGSSGPDRWLATSIKINRKQLEGAPGLRVGIVPARESDSDAIYMDDKRNLVVCPLPYNESFVETFYAGWETVRQFLHADANMPKEVALSRPAQRQVARYLVDRRKFAVVDIIDTLGVLAQPELIESHQEQADLVSRREGQSAVETGAILTPMPKMGKDTT